MFYQVWDNPLYTLGGQQIVKFRSNYQTPVSPGSQFGEPGISFEQGIDRLNAEMRKVVADAPLRKKLSDQGVDLQASTRPELEALMKRDTDKWARLIKEANIQIE